MQRILIFRTGGIGDVILSSVSLNIIKQYAPEAEIIWVGREPAISLIKSFYPDIRFFELQRKKSNLTLFKLLRKSVQGLDLIIDLQKSPRTIFLGYLLKFYFKRTKYVSWNKLGLERSMIVLKSLLKGRSSSSNAIRKFLPTRVEAMALCTQRGLLKINIPANGNINPFVPNFIEKQKKEKSVALCLGSLYPLKELDEGKLHELTSYFIDELNIPEFYLLGDEDKYDIAEKLIKLYPGRHFFNYCGKTTLTEAAHIIEKCRFSLANDSALAHLSETVGTPVIMFFGPTHPCFGYRPFLPDSITFSTDIGCRPCHKSGNTRCRYSDELCKKEVDLTKVYLHSRQLMNNA